MSFNLILCLLSLFVAAHVKECNSDDNFGLYVHRIIGDKTLFRPTHCHQIYELDTTVRNGIYTIYPDGETKVSVACDFYNGGWTVIMLRYEGDKLNFNRTWSDYKMGFGYVNESYWMGLKYMRYLMKREPMSLRVDISNSLEDYFVIYDRVLIHPESKKYRIDIGDRIFGDISRLFSISSSSVFSTFDQDKNKNCSSYLGGGWWHDSPCSSNSYCLTCSLNATIVNKFDSFKIMLRPNKVDKQYFYDQNMDV